MYLKRCTNYCNVKKEKVKLNSLSTRNMCFVRGYNSNTERNLESKTLSLK